MLWFRYGSLFLLAGVGLGAFGAHALNDSLTVEARQTYQTAVLYHLVHGLGLLAVGWLATVKPAEPLVRAAGTAFVVGLLLFSGSLYALSMTGWRTFGLLTPFGGIAFLLGWLLLALAARR